MSTGLAAFNDLPTPDATARLLSCCAAPAWAAAVCAGRPYSNVDAALTTAASASAGLAWDQIALALAAHPRIGERATGNSAEATWSRTEQSAAATADHSRQAELAQANRDYEARFGHIYLVFAAGRSAEQLLAEARRRLGNDAATEQGEVRRELGLIAARRLGELLA